MELQILNGVKENEERAKAEAQRFLSLLEFLDLRLRRNARKFSSF